MAQLLWCSGMCESVDPGHATALLPGLLCLVPFREAVKADATSNDRQPSKELEALLQSMELNLSCSSDAAYSSDVRPFLEALDRSHPDSDGRSWLAPGDLCD